MSPTMIAENAAPPASTGSGPVRPSARVVLALVMAVLALMAAVAVTGIRVLGAQQDRSRDAVVTAIAREAVQNLLTIDPGDGKATMDVLMDEASGDFKQQLIAQTDAFSDAVKDAKVSSRGTVTESAIQYASDGHALLLVTADATVTNAAAPNGVQRQYRVVVELDHPDGASWTVSKLDFAP